MKRIDLKIELHDGEVDKLGGTLLGDDSYDTLITEDCDVYTKNGEPLIKYRRGAIPNQLCTAVFPTLREAASETNNRGMAAGKGTAPSDDRRKIGASSETRYKAIKKDGSLSKTNQAFTTVKSGIIGYTDRSPRFPYCRMTAFSLANTDKFLSVIPYIQFIDGVFKENLPERWKAQMEVIKASNPDFYIHNTSFSTVTVNKNFQTAVHKDEGDLKVGFGVMSCLRAGEYSGCYLCFPKYRVAVDMKTGDVLMADVHSWHGNTPLKGKIGEYERISLVFYTREGIPECGSATDEAKRASEQTEAFYQRQLEGKV